LEGEPSKKDRMLFNNALKAGDLGDDEPEQSEVARPDRDHYVRRVEQAVQMTEDGTLFEVNYTGRLRAEWRGESMPLYRRLVRGSGATHAGAALTPEGDVLSASPERFLKAIDGVVETRPIKGTRPRYSDPMEDQKTKRELLTDEKDRAENVMIVDLMRNDLTKVCELGSVRAEEVCALESFRDVHHLVSTVKGRLDRRFSPVAALLACFPPGSCTGAPKLRAIEAIAELEENPRGPYTGTLFFSQPDGYLDSSVLIRTASKCGSEIEFGIGGAVVADSQSEAEYQEALDKGAAFIRLGEAE
jgi:para-aminobenzoate synthetase component 1